MRRRFPNNQKGVGVIERKKGSERMKKHSPSELALWFCFDKYEIYVEKTMLTRAIRNAKALAGVEKSPFGALRPFLDSLAQCD